MRTLLLLFFCGLISCETSIEKNTLLGSWTGVQDDSKYPIGGFDKLTFYPNDSIRIELYIDDKLNQSFSGTYRIDKKRSTVITKVNSVEVQLEIIALSGKRLIVKDNNIGKITNYKRVQLKQ